MYLEPWQIFLAGIGAGWLIMFIFIILVVLINVRPRKVDVIKVPIEKEENDGGRDEI